MLRLILALISLTAVALPAAGQNLVLLEFDTDSYDSTLVQLSLLEQRGITPRHIMVPNFVIADFHLIPPHAEISGGGKSLHA